MIYESERASFMADHKSVSAQLTLGNFPTPFSNQTRSVATASQGHPPGAEAASRTLEGLSSLLPRLAGKQQKRGSAKGPENCERGQKIGRPHSGVVTRAEEEGPGSCQLQKGSGLGVIFQGEPRGMTAFVEPQLFPSIVVLLLNP